MNVLYFETEEEYLTWKEKNEEAVIIQIKKTGKYIKIIYMISKIEGD